MVQVSSTSGLVVARATDYISEAKANAKSVDELISTIQKVSNNEAVKGDVSTMSKFVEVRSNYLRDGALSFGDYGEHTLKFDGKGVARCPEHLLPLLRVLMRSKPGRFQILSSPTVEAPQEPTAAPPPKQDSAPPALRNALKELEETLSVKLEEESYAAALEVLSYQTPDTIARINTEIDEAIAEKTPAKKDEGDSAQESQEEKSVGEVLLTPTTPPAPVKRTRGRPKKAPAKKRASKRAPTKKASKES